MKILELRFKNLGSLYGEWIIDFTHSEYTTGGIFVLTGPTGAGKSTILDGICLALYGSTPRLGKITKNSNDIMSRQTGECYAEVLFESQSGRFRCHWEQRRARKRINGKLQDQEHHIADECTGKLIETKKSRVSRVIEKKTGMDFERFTRSILLAQGDFDTFLKADIEQKSKILEQITGTEIYSEISRRVHERQRDEREKLNLLLSEISGILILDPEQEKEIYDELIVNQKRESELLTKFNQIDTAIKWLNTIENLEEEICSLKDDAMKLKTRSEMFKMEREKLNQAKKAISLNGLYTVLLSLRKQQSDDQIILKTDLDMLPELELSAKIQFELLKNTEVQTLKLKEEQKVSAPLVQKIRFLDQQTAIKKDSIKETTDICNQETINININKQLLSKEHKESIKAEKTLIIIDQYFQDNARDEWLISGLTGIEEQIYNLLTKQKILIQKKLDLKKLDMDVVNFIKKLKEVSKQYSCKQEELKIADQNLQQQKYNLRQLLGEKLLREYRNEKENLLREMAFMRKIEELEDQRNRLENGKPCPLCGSIEHPFRDSNIPINDDIEQKIASLTKLIDRAEKYENNIKELEQVKNMVWQSLNESKSIQSEVTNIKVATERNLTKVKDEFRQSQSEFNNLKQAISRKLNPLGISEIPETDINSLLKSLKSRFNNWQEQVARKNKIVNKITTINSNIKHLDAMVDMHVKALIKKQEKLKILKQELSNKIEERKQLYGHKNPDDEENSLNNAIADAEKSEKLFRSKSTEQQQQLTRVKTRVDTLRKRINQRTSELEKAEFDFSNSLNLAGFLDEKHFSKVQLSQEEISVLSSRAKKLDDAKIELKARQKDRENRLNIEKSKNITDKTFLELELQFKEINLSLKELSDINAALKHKLKENSITKEQIKKKQDNIINQKKEYSRWDKLYGLIGSADGKKYRNFAQGLTFELMVSHANLQLEKMTDRYLLIRDEQNPLELNVIDNYQAGEIRSTKNLSGGESFIVSLSLALGLSKMASRKVRVDSLFLDEGFGTLDEESLETALTALSGLQQDGKLIGIISHVSLLKERISNQININPIYGGHSSLSGPGCTKL